MTGKIRPGSILNILLATIIAVGLLWSPADAKKKKRKKKPKSQKVLFLDTKLGITYDDNIIRYSDNDLDLYDTSPDSSRFSIDSKNDWIIKPNINIKVKGKLFGHTAWIGSYFDYFFYAKNDVRRYSKIGGVARYYFMAGGYVDLDYYYIPDYYYRNQLYLGNYVEARFSKHSINTEVGIPLAKNLKGDISYRYQSKSFNPEASERDLTVHSGKLNGVWQSTKKLKFWATYYLETATAAGADNPDLTVRDYSYDAWDFTLGSRFSTRAFGKLKPQLFGTLQFRQIKFQTAKYVDNYRFGRKDSNWKFVAGTTWHLPEKVQFDISYTYQQKGVQLQVPVLEPSLEYKANSISLIFGRNF